MDIGAAARLNAKADDRRARTELCATLLLYAAAMTTALAQIGTWGVMLPAMVVAAAMGLRVYMIQHVCLHGSFFSTRKANDTVGKLLRAALR